MSATAVAKKKTERVELKTDSDWLARTKGAADRLGVSVSAYIRIAVNEKIARDDQQFAESPSRGEPK